MTNHKTNNPQNKSKITLSVMTLLFFVVFLQGCGVDLYVPSLPVITQYFHSPAYLIQLTISLYILGYACGQLVLGLLSDRFGRRPLFLACCFLYVLTSLMCAFSMNPYMLILSRFLQGICIAGIALARAIIADCLSDIALSKAFSTFSIFWALGPIIGPLIGSYLQHYFCWQANFYFFAAYGFVAGVVAFFILPETNQSLSQTDARQVFSNLTKVATHSGFLALTVICALGYASLVVFNIIGPYLVQLVLHYSVLDYGRFALLLGSGYFVGNVSNRFLLNHFHPNQLSLFGLAGSIAIAFVTTLLDIHFRINIYLVLMPTFLLFALCGLTFPNVAARCVGMFPNSVGTASAVYGLIFSGGVFLFTALATNLKLSTLLPMMLLYDGFYVVSLLLFLFADRHGKSHCSSRVNRSTILHNV